MLPHEEEEEAPLLHVLGTPPTREWKPPHALLHPSAVARRFFLERRKARATAAARALEMQAIARVVVLCVALVLALLLLRFQTPRSF